LKMMNRKEKIKFLSDLQAGRKTVTAILPPSIELWHLNDDGTEYKNNAGLVLTKKQYEVRESKQGNVINILIVRGKNGNCN